MTWTDKINLMWPLSNPTDPCSAAVLFLLGDASHATCAMPVDAFLCCFCLVCQISWYVIILVSNVLSHLLNICNKHVRPQFRVRILVILPIKLWPMILQLALIINGFYHKTAYHVSQTSLLMLCLCITTPFEVFYERFFVIASRRSAVSMCLST